MTRGTDDSRTNLRTSRCFLSRHSTRHPFPTTRSPPYGHYAPYGRVKRDKERSEGTDEASRRLVRDSVSTDGRK